MCLVMSTVVKMMALVVTLSVISLNVAIAANYNKDQYDNYNNYYGQSNSWYEQNSIELPPGRREGCSVKGLCCEGKNNTCVAEGPRMNDAQSELCFCDSPCRQLGDCCTDYDDHCTGKTT